jgi:hypothetical protein
MKITKTRLNQLIQEEYERMLNEGLGDWLTGAASGVGRLGRNLANTIYDATARPDIPSTRVGPAANVSRMQTPEERTAEQEDLKQQLEAGASIASLAGAYGLGAAGAAGIPHGVAGTAGHGLQVGAKKAVLGDMDTPVAMESGLRDVYSAARGGQGQPTPNERAQQQQQLAMNSPRRRRRPRRGASK